MSQFWKQRYKPQPKLSRWIRRRASGRLRKIVSRPNLFKKLRRLWLVRRTFRKLRVKLRVLASRRKKARNRQHYNKPNIFKASSVIGLSKQVLQPMRLYPALGYGRLSTKRVEFLPLQHVPEIVWFRHPPVASNTNRLLFPVTSPTISRSLRNFWKLGLRLRFERLLFNQVGRPVYVWFHNVWSLYSKHRRRLVHFESRWFWRLTGRAYRGRVRLSERWARIFLRTLCFLGSVSGGLHCFTHVVCFLMRKFRRHWAFFKFVRSYLIRVQRRFKTLRGARILITGKLGGALRARKAIFTIGKPKLFKLRWRTDYCYGESFTKWGVFGVHIWLQQTIRRRKPHLVKFKQGKFH